jgi:hypothetical protein
MEGHRDLWKGRITQDYRFVFRIEGDTYVLLDIGPTTSINDIDLERWLSFAHFELIARFQSQRAPAEEYTLYRHCSKRAFSILASIIFKNIDNFI